MPHQPQDVDYDQMVTGILHRTVSLYVLRLDSTPRLSLRLGMRLSWCVLHCRQSESTKCAYFFQHIFLYRTFEQNAQMDESHHGHLPSFTLYPGKHTICATLTMALQSIFFVGCTYFALFTNEWSSSYQTWKNKDHSERRHITYCNISNLHLVVVPTILFSDSAAYFSLSRRCLSCPW